MTTKTTHEPSQDVENPVLCFETKLIALIESNELLYNRQHSAYKDRKTRQQIWKDIADKLERPEHQCKKKWKCIQDQYSRELRLAQSNPNRPIRWKHFPRLQFLQINGSSSSHSQDDQEAAARFETELIALVESNELLYNKQHSAYKERYTRQKIWKDIADKLERPENQCKTKWKTIKDKYTRELRLTKSNPNRPITWRLFSRLQFMQINGSSSSHSQDEDTSEEGEMPATNTHGPSQDDENPVASFENDLIALVKSHEMLYNKQHSAYADQKTRQQIWKDIADKLERPEQHCRGKWKYMKYRYYRELKKMQSNPNRRITWRNFPHMQFMEVNGSNSSHSQHQGTSQGSKMPRTMTNEPPHDDNNAEVCFENELIALVKTQEVLFNKQHSAYRDVNLKQTIWEDIASKLKRPVDQCQMKWRVLRQWYTREHKGLKRCKHHDLLAFLKNDVQQRNEENETIYAFDSLQITTPGYQEQVVRRLNSTTIYSNDEISLTFAQYREDPE